jgi:hypothetical protein
MIVLNKHRNLDKEEIYSFVHQIGSDYSKQMESKKKIIQVDWHPLCPFHVVLLTSDNIISLINISENEYLKPEKTINLNPNERKIKENEIVSFSFGKGETWAKWTIFYVDKTGGLYSLCPVIPMNSFVRYSKFDGISEEIVNKVLDKREFGRFENKDYLVMTKKHDLKVSRNGPHKYINECIDIFTKNICCDMKIIPNENYLAFAFMNEVGEFQTSILLGKINPFSKILPELYQFDTLDLHLKNNLNLKPYFFVNEREENTLYSINIFGVTEIKFPYLLDLNKYLNDLNCEKESITTNHIIQTALEKPNPPIGIFSYGYDDDSFHIFVLDSSNILLTVLKNLFDFSTYVESKKIEFKVENLEDFIYYEEVNKINGKYLFD